MSKSFKVLLPLVVLASATGVALFPRHDRTAGSAFRAIQSFVPQDLSGTYKGTIYLQDKKNTQYEMVGPAKLEIQADRFTLSNNAGKQFKGEIKASIIPEKENLGVGQLKLDNQDAFEIRWHRDTSQDILKIVRARGANREFRFCSAKLTQAQCFGRISTPPATGGSRKPGSKLRKINGSQKEIRKIHRSQKKIKKINGSQNK